MSQVASGRRIIQFFSNYKIEINPKKNIYPPYLYLIISCFFFGIILDTVYRIVRRRIKKGCIFLSSV